MKIIGIIVVSIVFFIGCEEQKSSVPEHLKRVSQNIKQAYIDKHFWQDEATNKNNEMSWYDAKAYCEQLSLDGKNGWRLPTYKELEYLTTFKMGLDYVEPFYYWSETVHTSKPKTAHFSYFGEGCLRNNAPMKKKYLVRCIHDARV
jgi:formylglycine-generating enzyme required for sulfatase activity